MWSITTTGIKRGIKPIPKNNLIATSTATLIAINRLPKQSIKFRRMKSAHITISRPGMPERMRWLRANLSWRTNILPLTDKATKTNTADMTGGVNTLHHRTGKAIKRIRANRTRALIIPPTMPREIKESRNITVNRIKARVVLSHTRKWIRDIRVDLPKIRGAIQKWTRVHTVDQTKARAAPSLTRKRIMDIEVDLPKAKNGPLPT